jgi:hypothetical protein
VELSKHSSSAVANIWIFAGIIPVNKVPALAIISKKMIYSRISRGNHTGQKFQLPFQPIDDLLYSVCIAAQISDNRFGEKELRSFMQSLAEGSIYERLMSAWEKKTVPNFDLSQGLQIGQKYANNFMKRFPELFSTAVATQESVRIEWCTDYNFRIMYNNVYKLWIAAGVAQRLPEPVWMDGEGNVVKTEEEAVGLKVDVDLLHPNEVIAGDKVGCNLS